MLRSGEVFSRPNFATSFSLSAATSQEAERQERVKELRGETVEEEHVHTFFKEFTAKMTGETHRP